MCSGELFLLFDSIDVTSPMRRVASRSRLRCDGRRLLGEVERGCRTFSVLAFCQHSDKNGRLSRGMIQNIIISYFLHPHYHHRYHYYYNHCQRRRQRRCRLRLRRRRQLRDTSMILIVLLHVKFSLSSRSRCVFFKY